MKIVITHLTRMQRGYCCVAGMDLKTGAHVRCVCEQGRQPVSVLASHGGAFDMARVVELDGAKHAPEPPHTEDHVIGLDGIRTIPRVAPRWFWRFVHDWSDLSLQAVFGRELQQVGPRSCAIIEGFGRVSLGLFRPRQRPELMVKEEEAGDQIRMKIGDERFNVNVSVTDVRLYEVDHVTPNRCIVEAVAGAIERGVGLVLSVGLTRAFANYHWLQVNNIHLESDPTWRLGTCPVT
ncbi:MAG: hypothetical protein JW889_14330 [Verrucomicrobia bacterium]|nr:hypothetical protein [Verrucomicrobiota bacterium]